MTDPVEVMARAIWQEANPLAPEGQWTENAGYYLAEARAALTALKEAGWAVVPVEITDEMRKVGTEARWQSAVRDANNVGEIWSAMLSAAPPVKHP